MRTISKITITVALLAVVLFIWVCGCTTPTTPGSTTNHDYYLRYAKSAVEHIAGVDESALTVSDSFDNDLGIEYAKIGYTSAGVHHVVTVMVQGHEYYGANVGYDINYYHDEVSP